jgi:hypothetical protein
MKLLSGRPLEIISELLDNEGHVAVKLAEKLEMQETNISADLTKLKEQSIVYGETDEVKKKERGLTGPVIFLYIGPKGTASSEEKLDIFQLILRSFLEEQKTDLQEKLLASEYVNSLINSCGLRSFYEIIEEYMGRKEFRKIASRALLSQTALIEKYQNLPTSLRQYVEEDKERIQNFTSYFGSNLYLILLFKLDAMESVRFHRKYLAKDFLKLYKDLMDMEATRSANPDITEGIIKFLELDIHLSPATSFPQNNPVNLLLAKPFERLYNDVYICDDLDYELMARRAYLVYSHFAEILGLGIRSVRSEEDRWERENDSYSKSNEDILESRKYYFIRKLRKSSFSKKSNLDNLIKELILYWNIASLRLDFNTVDKNIGRRMGQSQPQGIIFWPIPMAFRR